MGVEGGAGWGEEGGGGRDHRDVCLKPLRGRMDGGQGGGGGCEQGAGLRGWVGGRKNRGAPGGWVKGVSREGGRRMGGAMVGWQGRGARWRRAGGRGSTSNCWHWVHAGRHRQHAPRPSCRGCCSAGEAGGTSVCVRAGRRAGAGGGHLHEPAEEVEAAHHHRRLRLHVARLPRQVQLALYQAAQQQRGGEGGLGWVGSWG